jgi:hypothetical protein
MEGHCQNLNQHQAGRGREPWLNTGKHWHRQANST